MQGNRYLIVQTGLYLLFFITFTKGVRPAITYKIFRTFKEAVASNWFICLNW